MSSFCRPEAPFSSTAALDAGRRAKARVSEADARLPALCFVTAVVERYGGRGAAHCHQFGTCQRASVTSPPVRRAAVSAGTGQRTPKTPCYTISQRPRQYNLRGKWRCHLVPLWLLVYIAQALENLPVAIRPSAESVAGIAGQKKCQPGVRNACTRPVFPENHGGIAAHLHFLQRHQQDAAALASATPTA